MYLGLTGKKIVITGASRGLGLATAKCFLSEGAKVLLCARNERLLAQNQALLANTYGQKNCYFVAADICTATGLNSLLTAVCDYFGRIDSIICNLGSGKSSPTLMESDEDWSKMFELNFFSAVNTVRKLIPYFNLQEDAVSAMSSITFVNTICSSEALGAPVTYSSSKSALLSYAKSISKLLAKQNIRVNTVSPGNIIFPGSTWEEKLSKNKAAVDEMLEKEVALKRFATAEEVAKVITFISSSAASFVCGSNWIVDGGQLRSY